MLWLRSMRFVIAFVCFAGLLPSCSGDGSSVSPRIAFGINGSGSCEDMVVDVDLDKAFAVLARKSDGSVDCAASALLDASCDVSFAEISSGAALRVTIDDCDIPPIVGLFECGFSKADTGLLQTRVAAECSCATPRCDETPPVCASRDHNPYFCEDCVNGRDDDDDHLVDCGDPNCEHSYACDEPASTTTSTTSSTGTIPPSSSTTTTLPVAGFTLTYGIADAANIGSIKWDTGYSDISARERSTPGNPECTSLVPGADAVFTNDAEAQLLHASISGLSGSAGPLELAACTFEGSAVPTAQDFDVAVVEARDTEQNLIVSPPDVGIEDIDIHVVTTTTLPSDTTSTTATTVPLGDSILATFRLNSVTSTLGALQLAVHYSGAPGEFTGSGAAVACTYLPAATALFAANDVEQLRQLHLGILSLTGFAAPIDLVQCSFHAEIGNSPVPGDFVVEIVDATDLDGGPVNPVVSVRLQPAE